MFNVDLLLISFNSDVKLYDPSGDSTLPTAAKKRKIEEVEEAEEEDKPVEVKAKKIKKETPTEGERKNTVNNIVLISCIFEIWNESNKTYLPAEAEEAATEETETPKKKKKKKKQQQEEEVQIEEEAAAGPSEEVRTENIALG